MEASHSTTAGGHVPIETLFSVVDKTFDQAPKEARIVLENIVAMVPSNDRATHLLEILETSEIGPYDLRVAPVGELLHSVMEAAETLLIEGCNDEARDVVEYVGRRYDRSPEARAWLQSINLLLD